MLIQKHNTYYSQFVSKLKSVFYFALFNEAWCSGGKKNNSTKNQGGDDDGGEDDDDEDQNNLQEEREDG
jgi:hypothetical protein